MRVKSGPSRPWLVGGLLLLTLACPPPASAQDHPDDKPLLVAADVGFAPFIMKKTTGGEEGFMVDMVAEIAARLGRPGYKIEDVNFSAIFAGLFAKRYEFVLAPTALNPQRAQEMLFTEPYMNFTLGFLLRRADRDIANLEELRGKVLAVSSGSIPDGWAKDNQARYGFEIQRFDKIADAYEALLTSRVYSVLSDDGNLQWVKTQVGNAAKIGMVINTPLTRAIPFRKDDVEFRNRVERILEGMKLDGSLAAMHLKWFGVPPQPGSAMGQVSVGYGPVGFPGFTFEPHAPQFK